MPSATPPKANDHQDPDNPNPSRIKIAPNPGSKKVQTAHFPTYNSLPKETQTLYQTPQQRPFFLKQSVLTPIHRLPMSNSVPHLTFTNPASPIHLPIQTETNHHSIQPRPALSFAFLAPTAAPAQFSSAQSKQPTAVFRNTSPHPNTNTRKYRKKGGDRILPFARLFPQLKNHFLA